MTIKELYKGSFNKIAAYGMSELHAQDITAAIATDQAIIQTPQTRHFFKRPVVILVTALCVLLIGTTAFAAASGFFTRGLNSIFKSDADLQQMLLDSGLVTIFDESDAITIDGVTIQPTVMITDGGRLYLAFKVKDYDTGEYIRPEFSNHVEVDIYDGVDLTTDSCTGGVMGFYAETIPGAESESGDNITSGFGIPWGEYYDSEHNLEYIINVVAERSTFGQTVHVEFSGISSYNSKWNEGNNIVETPTGLYWAANTVSGPWVFDLKIPERTEKADELLRNTHPISDDPIWKGVYIDYIEITPLRINVHARATEEAETIQYYHIDDWYEYDRTGVEVTKIRLKSGEIIDYANDRIIDPREIAGIYIRELIHTFREGVIGEENYYTEEQLIELE